MTQSLWTTISLARTLFHLQPSTNGRISRAVIQLVLDSYYLEKGVRESKWEQKRGLQSCLSLCRIALVEEMAQRRNSKNLQVVE
jgi:hypothetical protein